MSAKLRIVCVAGPTASGKSARAVALGEERGGEVISVDSRQVYRMLDIGTEKTNAEEMRGIPHHLINIRDPRDAYSAGDFVADASRLIMEITARGKLPILAGGTHFYFDSLLFGLPSATPHDERLRQELDSLPDDELLARIKAHDPRRAAELDPQNRRRLIRALEIIERHGKVPERPRTEAAYNVEWVVIDPPMPELKERIRTRLETAVTRGLVEEVRRVREYVGDARLDELGLEYRIVGEYLRGERSEASLIPSLISALNGYARHQKAWLRKLGST